jgi:hypothetical protein
MAATPADRLIAKLEARRASGERVARADGPARAAAKVAEWGAQRVLLADDPWLDDLGVPEELAGAGVEVVRWPPPGIAPATRGGADETVEAWRELMGLEGPTETVGVTVPARGVAERGTLVLESDAAHGRGIDVVSARHLAILPAERVVETLGEALAATYAPGRRPPSAVSLVSAPSRTSDIEKISTLGAHGALALHLLVVDEG